MQEIVMGHLSFCQQADIFNQKKQALKMLDIDVWF